MTWKGATFVITTIIIFVVVITIIINFVTILAVVKMMIFIHLAVTMIGRAPREATGADGKLVEATTVTASLELT